MKWYKHINDSLDDPFIFDLMTKHGAEGYLVFFGTIEIYSREFKPENGWNLVVSLSFLQKKFRISKKKIIKILQNITKWDVKVIDSQVFIFIPKFTALLDEWTQRKLGKTRELLGSESGVTPEILKHELDLELDLELDTTKSKPEVSPCPHLLIIEEYNRLLPTLSQVRPKLWNGKRAAALQARWREDEARQNLGWWTGLFDFIRENCPFLIGENDNKWQADLDWIIQKGNMPKILEGKYARK